MSEIIGLIEMARGLVQRKGELDRQYFANFIEPAWQAFKVVHESYKADFDKYFEMATKYNDLVYERNGAELIEELKRDTIITANLRIELIEILRHTPSNNLSTSGNLFAIFVSAIILYFDHRADVSKDASKNLEQYKARVYDVLIRTTMIRMLARENSISETKVLEVLNWSRRELQLRYERVAEAYYALRKSILT